jgi:predicted DNA-binding ribbon-helix-helix protein
MVARAATREERASLAAFNAVLDNRSSARMGAVTSTRVEDFFVQGRRGWVRLNEKGGKENKMPHSFFLCQRK